MIETSIQGKWIMLQDRGQTEGAQVSPFHSSDLADKEQFWRSAQLATAVPGDSREFLNGDAIILNQLWTLEVVSTMFGSTSKAFKNIKRNGGRFHPSELVEWVWQEHGVPDQEQERILSLMRQGGLCFLLRRGDKDVEAEYIAPDLLSARDDPSIALELRQKWEDYCDAEATLSYESLPPDLMRTLTARIGEKAGLAGVYWRDGFYFYDESTCSRAIVAQQGTSSQIHVETQRGQAQKLLRQLLEFIDECQGMLGVRATGRTIEARENDSRPVAATFKPVHERSAKPEYFVSYAWGDNTPEGREREAVVDELCKKALENRDITINMVRDKTAIRYGDRISKFMSRIAEGDRIFIVLSDKYLKSANCMHELLDVWRNCREENNEFVARTRVFVLPCAKISTEIERGQYAIYWRKKLEETDAYVKEYGQLVLSDDGNAEYRFMKHFVDEVPNILQLVQDVLRPQTFEDFVAYGFDEPGLKRHSD